MDIVTRDRPGAGSSPGGRPVSTPGHAPSLPLPGHGDAGSQWEERRCKGSALRPVSTPPYLLLQGLGGGLFGVRLGQGGVSRAAGQSEPEHPEERLHGGQSQGVQAPSPGGCRESRAPGDHSSGASPLPTRVLVTAGPGPQGTGHCWPRTQPCPGSAPTARGPPPAPPGPFPSDRQRGFPASRLGPC